MMPDEPGLAGGWTVVSAVKLELTEPQARLVALRILEKLG